ncbi:MAG: TrkA C-terminal domain-containing protein, partial [Bacteroidota bacterium]
MVQAFIENPILLLFIVVGIGYGIGSIKVRGTGLGVAAVLFVGLFFGSLDAALHIPEEIIFLGLSIFIYSVGLSSGPSFLQLFRQRGSRDLVFVFAMLSFSALVTLGFHYLFLFEPATSAGLFAGSTTNTPALAGVLDQISNSIQDAANQRTVSELSVIAYSLSYPMGVIGPMLAIQWMQRLFRIDYREEERQLRKVYPVRQDIASYTIVVKNEAIVGKTIRDLKQECHWTVIFGRLDRNGEETLTNWDTTFELNDKVAVVGDREEVDAVAAEMGEMLPYKLSYDQSAYATEQIFVSNDKIAGKKLAGLNLSEKFSVLISRVTRGDIDLLANSDTVLEMGDRVRLVTRRKDMPELKKLLGNSFEQLSKIDLLSFGFGLALGLMLGMVNIEIPGGINFRLGYAGGPIIVGLVLGGLRRTGPINWQLPYGANVL